MLCMEHGFTSALELLVGAFSSMGGSLIRVVLLELQRLLSHLLGVACHSGDLGQLSFLVWLFEDREVLYLLSAGAGGARLHVCEPCATSSSASDTDFSIHDQSGKAGGCSKSSFRAVLRISRTTASLSRDVVVLLACQRMHR